MTENGKPEETGVVIVGGGPVGLMLAAELGLQGIRTIVLERLLETSREWRAAAVIGQAVQLLHHRGLYGRLSGTAGPPRPTPGYVFGGFALDLAGLTGNPLYGLPIPQWDLEAGLAARAVELGADLRRGQEMQEFEQDAEGVTVTLSSGATIRAKYLVGCDGARSSVRKACGIGFAGSTSEDILFRRAHADLPASSLPAITGSAATVPDAGGARGALGYFRLERGTIALVNTAPDRYIVAVLEWGRSAPPDDEPVTFDEIRAAVARVAGVDVPMSQPPAGTSAYTLMRRAHSNTRLADRYRAGRVLLAGDAAHVHSSIGAPGLNLGLQDAANLGWKLAGAVRGWAPAALLDTYEAERRPVAERVATQTRAQAALLRPGDDVTAIRSVLGELIAEPENTRRIAALMAGSDLRYGGDTDSPTGRFVEDFALTADGRETRLCELARTGRPLLIGDGMADAAAGWKDRVDLITADVPGLLVRPDGYAAWSVADTSDPTKALHTWFGEPTKA